MLTQRQLDASREARLWIGQIIVPALLGGALIMTNPEAKAAVTNFKNKTVTKVKSMFQKEKG